MFQRFLGRSTPHLGENTRCLSVASFLQSLVLFLTSWYNVSNRSQWFQVKNTVFPFKKYTFVPIYFVKFWWYPWKEGLSCLFGGSGKDSPLKKRPEIFLTKRTALLKFRLKGEGECLRLSVRTARKTTSGKCMRSWMTLEATTASVALTVTKDLSCRRRIWVLPKENLRKLNDRCSAPAIIIFRHFR